MNEPVISFKNVTKKYFMQDDRTFKEFLPSLLKGKSWAKQFSALSDVSFEINAGETIGIVGKNGSGKSTTLKMIAGVSYPTSGKVETHGKVAPLIELGAGFHHELTGHENIYLNAAIIGLHKKEVELILDDVIEFSELREFIDVPVKKYSSGMYMRLAFSIAVFTNAPILLIDEVLAVGDAAFQDKCLKKLQELKSGHNKTIVFVSHNEKAVKSFCNRAILLDQGKLVMDSTPGKVFEKYHSLTHLKTS